MALPGAAEAVEQMGRAGEVPVTGLSTPNEMKPYLESGAVKEFVLWNPVDLGYLAVYVANAQVDDKLPSSGTSRPAVSARSRCSPKTRSCSARPSCSRRRTSTSTTSRERYQRRRLSARGAGVRPGEQGASIWPTSTTHR